MKLELNFFYQIPLLIPQSIVKSAGVVDDCTRKLVIIGTIVLAFIAHQHVAT